MFLATDNFIKALPDLEPFLVFAVASNAMQCVALVITIILLLRHHRAQRNHNQCYLDQSCRDRQCINVQSDGVQRIHFRHRQRDLEAVLLWQHLLVIGEAALDQPAVNHRPLRLHQDLVGPQGDADDLVRLLQVAFQQSHSLGRHDGACPAARL